MRRSLVLVACLFMVQVLSFAQSEHPLLLRHPTMSRTQVVFSFAGDLWIVARDGGDARRLTSGIGVERDPFFSPDGQQVAFSGEYDGNQDVYVVPASGGVPKRLTYHPSADTVRGWTPDGRRIMFTSTRASYYHFADQIFTVPAGGGFAVQVPLPIVEDASYSADASSSRTCRTRSGNRRGNGIAAVRRRRSGSRTCRIRRFSRSRARTRTTSTRCGSATRSTSSRIETVR